MPLPDVIAIDGPSAVGKNTVGARLAERLGYGFLDTGAMYRAITLVAIEQGMDLTDEPALTALADRVSMELRKPDDGQGHNSILVDGRNVTDEIRREDVEKGVSLVSSVAGVREAMVARQRELATGSSMVLVGRDIGTVVLPYADLKVFLTASPEERAKRRHLEMLEKGQQADYDSVLSDLKRRDDIDSRRAHSPLKAAADAVLVDTDGISADQVVTRILSMVDTDK